MSEPARSTEVELARLVAERLGDLGYRVALDPRPSDLPFDMGGYRPDMIARRGEEGLVIELKPSERGVALDRFADIAELVSEHAGWRFLLLPGDRIAELDVAQVVQLPDWQNVAHRLATSRRLIETEAFPSAFVIAWTALEAMLRRIGEDQAVPVSAMSPAALMTHLYSFGILDRAQRDTLRDLLPARNAAVHGMLVADVARQALTLAVMCEALFTKWAPPDARSGER